MNASIAIIGGGPSGLIAAEILSARGYGVRVYERKASVGRKFLMAGRGGLNLTHSENLDDFIKRYGSQTQALNPLIQSFTPQMLREWCETLGEKTFVGSSGRVFPESFKASPLLRAWIKRLEKQNVQFMLNYDWQGWDGDQLMFNTPDGVSPVSADAVLLALGGASWPRLGTDGSWVSILEGEGIAVAPLKPANCGFTVDWSDMFRTRFAGHPLKPVIASCNGTRVQSEIMMTQNGIEGGAIYALSSILRDQIDANGSAELRLDLKPDLDLAAITARLQRPRGRDSFSNHLRKTLGLSPIAIGVIMESPDRQHFATYPADRLAHRIKHHPVILKAAFPIDRAISTAGGVSFDAMDDKLMLKGKPGVFIAGEMLDWEAPTGGYLLQASFATGVHAAHGIAAWIGTR